jgi:hypothetical protein
VLLFYAALDGGDSGCDDEVPSTAWGTLAPKAKGRKASKQGKLKKKLPDSSSQVC